MAKAIIDISVMLETSCRRCWTLSPPLMNAKGGALWHLRGKSI